MYSSSLHLRNLFRTILTSGLAAAAGCDEGVRAPYPEAAFDEAICGNRSAEWAERLTPTPAVDALLIREWVDESSYDGGAADLSFDRIVGTPCATATDSSACATSVGSLPLYPSLFAGSIGGGAIPAGIQLGYTRGDTVSLVDGADGLRALFGTIDTSAEAVLLASVGRWPICDRTNVRAVGSGFEVLLREGTGCGPDSDVYEFVVRVRADGSVTEVDRRLIERSDPNCAIGRLTDGVAIARGRAASLGEHFARMAALEAAAVLAFERLADELADLGAPTELVARARRSARDEARHVALVDAQRRRFGAADLSVDVAETRARSLFEIARENATEGMVRETYGALAATYHAQHARDPEIARLFRALAIDETRHAALSRDVGTFLEAKLSPEERAAIGRDRHAAASSLADSIAPELGDEVHDAMGWPRPAAARAMIDALFPAAWS